MTTRTTLRCTFAAGALIALIPLTGCDESMSEQAALPAAPAAPAPPPAAAPKRPTLAPDTANSALGKAKGAGERTVDRSDAYQDRLLREIEDNQ